MATHKKHTVGFRRREKTDYRKRLRILLSKKTRLVIRKSLKNVIIQMIKYEPDGDRILISAHSRNLEKFGWKDGKKNIPAAYLTGLLASMEAKKKGISDAILDTGLQTHTNGSRIYAALRGVVDGGINVAHSEKVLPSEERLRGEHIANYIKITKDKAQLNQFSKVSKETDLQNLQKDFENTKNKILKG